MRMRVWITALAAGMLAFCALAARAEDLGSVEKKIVKKWQQHRSMRAKFVRREATGGKTGKAVAHGEGSYAFMRRGGKLLFRREIKTTMEVNAGGQKMKFELSELTVCDGKFIYTLSDRVGMKSVTKSRPDPGGGEDLEALLETLRAENRLKLLDPATVAGQDAYVIEATPKRRPTGRPYQTVVYYFSKEHGVLLKQESRDREGKAVQTTTYADLEFDVKIDPKQFEFQAPEGIPIKDQTAD